MTLALDARMKGVLLSAGDGLLAVALFAGSLKAVLNDLRSPAVAVTIVALGTLPIAVRRRWPLIVLLSVTAANCALLALAQAMVAGPLCEAVAIYSIARHRDLRPALISAAGALLALMAAFLASVTVTKGSPPISTFAPMALMAGAIAALAGTTLRAREAHLRGLKDRVSSLLREQQANEARAVLEERARISRDLHDIVAHHLSVVVLQAGAALTLLGKNGHPAAEPVGAIERTAREALVEMRRMLGALRSHDGPDAYLTPAAGLGALDALASQVRAAGLPVDLVIQGQPRPIPSDLDRSAYRIVQEALTNCLRHAGPAKAGVRIGYEADRLELEVTDTGSGQTPPAGQVSGHGLIGMRERAVLLGGEFQASPGPTGGFTVRVRLPLPPQA